MKSVFFNNDILSTEKEIIKETGIPDILLMENAGKNSADIIGKIYFEKKCDCVCILAGKGNNAGDGFVIARHLIGKKINVKLFLLFPEEDLKGIGLKNFEILKGLPNNKSLTIVRIDTIKDFKSVYNCSNPVFVDSVFGIGFRGVLEERLIDIFSFINNIKNKLVIAIDTVSGLENYYEKVECLNADTTISMGVKKFNSVFEYGREKSGKIKVIDIGIPVDLIDKHNIKKIFELEKSDIAPLIPRRGINSHKYTNGKLFILSGSIGYTGASYLCSVSALKSGCGAVILGLPESLNSIMEEKTTEVITLPLKETSDITISNESNREIEEKLKWCDAFLIGPGIGRNAETMGYVRKLIKDCNKPLVIDADGLFALKDNLDILKKNNNIKIITPHFGEFSNMLGISTDELKKDFYNISLNFAKNYSVILVLKNSPSIITDGEYFYINSTGRENLATVGSGDVLSGIISGFLAQIKNGMNSALTGVYIHGQCGDNLYKISGNSSTISSELIEQIAFAKNNLETISF